MTIRIKKAMPQDIILIAHVWHIKLTRPNAVDNSSSVPGNQLFDSIIIPIPLLTFKYLFRFTSLFSLLTK